MRCRRILLYALAMLAGVAAPAYAGWDIYTDIDPNPFVDWVPGDEDDWDCADIGEGVKRWTAKRNTSSTVELESGDPVEYEHERGDIVYERSGRVDIQV